MVMATAEKRICRECSAVLSRYNRELLCAPCIKKLGNPVVARITRAAAQQQRELEHQRAEARAALTQQVYVVIASAAADMLEGSGLCIVCGEMWAGESGKHRDACALGIYERAVKALEEAG